MGNRHYWGVKVYILSRFVFIFERAEELHKLEETFGLVKSSSGPGLQILSATMRDNKSEALTE